MRAGGFTAGHAAARWRHWQARRRRAASRPNPLSAPFPFLKGPLMVYTEELARELAHSPHTTRVLARRVQPLLPKGPPRVLHDVFLGYVLASSGVREVRVRSARARVHAGAQCTTAATVRSYTTPLHEHTAA